MEKIAHERPGLKNSFMSLFQEYALLIINKFTRATCNLGTVNILCVINYDTRDRGNFVALEVRSAKEGISALSLVRNLKSLNCLT